MSYRVCVCVFSFNSTFSKLNMMPLNQANVPSLGFSVLENGTIIQPVALIRGLS